MITIENRLSGAGASIGRLKNESGLDEKCVSLMPPRSRMSMVPGNDTLGSRMQQSPQICLAFHCQASIRSETGRSSVENNCDIVGPELPCGSVCQGCSTTGSVPPRHACLRATFTQRCWRGNVTHPLTGLQYQISGRLRRGLAASATVRGPADRRGSVPPRVEVFNT